MTGTGPEPPAVPATEDDHRYFLAVEEAFLRLRGKATLLAANDWQVAQAWHRAGIPVEVVEKVMEELFARAAERRQRTISSLRYFKAAVASAWEEIEALSAGGRKERLRPFRADLRLARLAAALPSALPDAERWSARIRTLEGDVQEVEERLAAIDRELVRALAARAADRPQEESARDAAEIERALAPLASRLPPEELAVARSHLEAQKLRQRHGLPVLSLFAPEASDPDEPEDGAHPGPTPAS